eukprot:snap_masked-scaffold_11-processed-gene-1.37-mRNA-1 protein AED:0.26 eAED:0.26 QI:0/-1/0/1/-1/1/1/0/366
MPQQRKRKLRREDSDAVEALLELNSNIKHVKPSLQENIQKPTIVKGSWSAEEDKQMLAAVEIYKNDWKMIASQVKGRTAKQCRDRFRLKLDPNINHGPWTPEEDELLLKLHEEVGRQWTRIAKLLPGRTENAVKSRYSSLFRSRTKDWTVEEEGLLRQLRTQGMSFGDIAKTHLPHRSEHAVKKRWEKLIMSDIAERVKQDFPQSKPIETNTSSRRTSSGFVGKVDPDVKLNPALAASTLSSVSREPTQVDIPELRVKTYNTGNTLTSMGSLGFNLSNETILAQVSPTLSRLSRKGSSFSFSNVLSNTETKPKHVGSPTVASTLNLNIQDKPNNKPLEGIKRRAQRFKRHSTSTTVMMQLLGEPLP